MRVYERLRRPVGGGERRRGHDTYNNNIIILSRSNQGQQDSDALAAFLFLLLHLLSVRCTVRRRSRVIVPYGSAAHAHVQYRSVSMTPPPPSPPSPQLLKSSVHKYARNPGGCLNTIAFVLIPKTKAVKGAASQLWICTFLFVWQSSITRGPIGLWAIISVGITERNRRVQRTVVHKYIAQTQTIRRYSNRGKRTHPPNVEFSKCN